MLDENWFNFTQTGNILDYLKFKENENNAISGRHSVPHGRLLVEMSSSKGIVSDATMNMVTIVTDKNDTLSFSTMDANKE